ncbi:MAG TPA: nuclear transport factor 2 family protein [Polyangiaceae bacterium]|nr:nuclear transport factor 2 family protein [Polyangiaceae bacterium]
MINWSFRPRAIAATVAAVAVTSILAAAPEALAAPSSSEADSTTSDADGGLTAVNKAMVSEFFEELFNEHDLSAIDTYVASDYIPHSPTIGDGAEAFKQAIMNREAIFPNDHNFIYRVFAENDLVLIHSDVVFTPGGPGQSNLDVFRVADGKIVEHWGEVQSAPATTASGNDMFATLSAPQTGDPDPRAPTARNKQIVLDYFTRLNKNHDLTAIDRYVDPTLFQHDPTLLNGSAATKSAYADIFANFPEFTTTSIKVVAEGDLISVRYHYQTSSSDLGQAVQDIFRVRAGKIVEHWSTKQDVPANSVSSMF